MKIVIIGGVAGGATAAARIRRLSEDAQITVLERGEYISFANCGLPYYIGGEIADEDDLKLQTPESFGRRYNVDVHVLSEATEILSAERLVKVKNLADNSEYTLGYDKLLIATGAQPAAIGAGEEKSARVFTLRTIPDSARIKAHAKPGASACVIGGGFVGLETAENLMNAGVDVTLLEAGAHILSGLDAEVAAEVETYLKSRGLKLFTRTAVSAISDVSGGVEVRYGTQAKRFDFVVLAAGVRPESGLAKRAGLKIGERGGIWTDSRMRTSDESIYAVGDAVETVHTVTRQHMLIPLAGPANRQARVAANNMCGADDSYDSTQGSAIIKLFDMTVAFTGANERAAAAAGFDCDKVYTSSASHATYYPGAKSLNIKVVFERGTGRILGAQLTGFGGVDKRADVLAVAVRLGLTAKQLTQLELCYAPPYSSAKDPVNIAGYAIENIVEGRVKNFHFDRLDELKKRGGVTLLDVRTRGEHRRGAIEGFINIPLDELRQRAPAELDKSLPVYIHCLSGMRSYLACRILTAQGFDCYNLSGGYRLYSAAHSAR